MTFDVTNWYFPSSFSPTVCAGQQGCANCNTLLGCGWCAASQRCVRGDSSGPLDGTLCLGTKSYSTGSPFTNCPSKKKDKKIFFFSGFHFFFFFSQAAMPSTVALSVAPTRTASGVRTVAALATLRGSARSVDLFFFSFFNFRFKNWIIYFFRRQPVSAHLARRACIARLKVVRASTCPTLRASLWEACSLALGWSEWASVATCFTRRGLRNTRAWLEWPGFKNK